MRAQPGRSLTVEPLTQTAFAAFGEYLPKKEPGVPGYAINDGHAMRYDDVFHLKLLSGKARTSLFVAKAVKFPITLWEMERHPQGSQAFVSIGGATMIAVVAPAGDFDGNAVRAFRVPPGCGINYSAGTWHHPLLSLDENGRFLVIDCATDEPNCDVLPLDNWILETSA